MIHSFHCILTNNCHNKQKEIKSVIHNQFSYKIEMKQCQKIQAIITKTLTCVQLIFIVIAIVIKQCLLAAYIMTGGPLQYFRNNSPIYVYV